MNAMTYSCCAGLSEVWPVQCGLGGGSGVGAVCAAGELLGGVAPCGSRRFDVRPAGSPVSEKRVRGRDAGTICLPGAGVYENVRTCLSTAILSALTPPRLCQ